MSEVHAVKNHEMCYLIQYDSLIEGLGSSLRKLYIIQILNPGDANLA